VPVVLALGLDPACVDLPENPELSPELIRASIESQFDRVRAMGYEVHSCLVKPKEAPEDAVSRQLQARAVDCVMFGAGLRAVAQLLLFENSSTLSTRRPEREGLLQHHAGRHGGGCPALGLG